MQLKNINQYFILSILFIFSQLCFSKELFKNIKGKNSFNLSDSSGKYLVWDSLTLHKIAPLQFNNTSYCGYPRMIQLQDKSLVCVYEISGGSINFIKSTDIGKTWSLPIIIAANVNGINRTVPEILQLADGSLLASFNLRPAVFDSSKHFGISTIKSYDCGLTWKDERNLYKASATAADGCWEPAQIQLPSGEIQLFFSNEGVYQNSNEQNISMFRSFDNGLSWTDSPQIISFRVGKRDGMPVPIILKGKNEIIFSIEDNGTGQFNPAIIRNSLIQNWNTVIDGSSLNRAGALSTLSVPNIYAGAPFLRQFKTGETILSYQSTEDRCSQWNLACMNVVIGDDNGTNFTHRSVPFKVPLNKMGLWNSLCVLQNNTVVALTSTNAYSKNNSVEIWIITGHLINR